MDTNRQPDHDTPLWSETRWNGCFNPDENVGLFLHAGRFRGHLDWWWVQTAVFLPEGRLAVERSWIRDPDPEGVRTPSLDLRMEQQGWSARFDAVAQLTTTEALATAARGSGAPVAPIRFDVTSEDNRPLWDMNAHQHEGDRDFGDMHIQHPGRSTGTVTVGDETHSLDGVSYHDHSSGPRDWANWGGHHFATILMPTVTSHAISVYAPDGSSLPPVGIWMADGAEPAALERTEAPRLADLLGGPEAYEFVVHPVGGAPQTFAVEILHNFPCMATEDNTNINGIDWDAEGDPLVLIESQARFTAPDGTVGHGHIERCSRRSAMTKTA